MLQAKVTVKIETYEGESNENLKLFSLLHRAFLSHLFSKKNQKMH
jgi:hypothetical protein